MLHGEQIRLCRLDICKSFLGQLIKGWIVLLHNRHGKAPGPGIDIWCTLGSDLQADCNISVDTGLSRIPPSQP